MNRLRVSPRAKLFGVVLSLIMWPSSGGGRLVEAHLLFGPSNLPTRSSPLVLSSDDRFVWAVNRENNSVSVIEVGNDLNQKVREIKVGAEPRSIAITPDRRKVYVTNMLGGTVSVVNATTLRGEAVCPSLI